jgi:uncharacterized cupredoxin-like copper-binding protein
VYKIVTLNILIIMNRLEKIILTIFLLTITGIQAQVGVGTRTPNPDAMLEVSATNKGLLLPRIALTASTAASPLSAHVAGMTVFNTASVADVTPGYYYNDGSKWLRLASDAVSDATTTISGKIKLAGDLGGTADAPSVPGLTLKANTADVTTLLAAKENTSNKSTDVTLADVTGAKFPTELAVKTYVDAKVVDGITDAITTSAPTQNAVFDALANKANTVDVTTLVATKENTITAGTTAQYFRGDKTFQTLDKTAVGLANVDNTTDAAKPISDLTQAALDLKAPLASPALSGVPTAPTAGAGTNTTQLATTAFVTSALGYDKLRGTVTTVTGSTYTISATDYLVITNAGVGVTITFPDLTAAEAGRTVFVFNNNTGALSNLIAGTNVIGQQTNTQFRAMEFVWSGAQWFIMGK